ncbi:uncharacterized protein isoform X3 [Salmo salar]|uniref:Uncharacterized protein isoform X3 n=1 Tax=Salmo salar TaxID=8030 RepID=A0ABM3C9A0_SALSA|nr:uncharacterized protein LOC106562879 isoform X3 [Salmo salar]
MSLSRRLTPTALPAESNRAGSMRRWRQMFTSLMTTRRRGMNSGRRELTSRTTGSKIVEDLCNHKNEVEKNLTEKLDVETIRRHAVDVTPDQGCSSPI